MLDAPWLSNGASIDGNIAGSHYVRDFKVHNLISEHGKVWNEPLTRKFLVLISLMSFCTRLCLNKSRMIASKQKGMVVIRCVVLTDYVWKS